MKGYVLIADADRRDADALRVEVEKLGAKCVVVRDGAAAHDALAERGLPLLLVVDLVLPKRDGFSVLRGLRRLDSNRATPAIAVSAFRAMCESAQNRRAELGPVAIVPKPLVREAVRKALHDALVGHPPKPTELKAPRPREEAQRLARIDEMNLVDPGEPDAELQSIVREAAATFDVPVALISLVLEDKLWFKAHVGLTGKLLADRGSPRDWAFCQHVVEGHRALVIPDAREHPVFADNPLVIDGTVVGYAGAPLATPSGDVLGSLCVMDQKPLAIGAADVEQLTLLARRVAGELELRASRRRSETLSKQLAATSVAPARMPELGYLEAIVSNIAVGLVLLDRERRAVYANATVGAMFGVDRFALLRLTRDEILMRFARSFSNPDMQVARLAIGSVGPYALREEIELASPQRRIVRWTAEPVALPDGDGQLMSFTDITAETDLSRERELLAKSDPLTKLLNRRGAEEVLGREQVRAHRYGSALSFALLDLDHFKRLNDTHGHAAGDAALIASGHVVRHELRATDAAARWGGEEFLLILPSTPREGARVIADRVREAIARAAGAVELTASGGIAQLEADESAERAIRRADEALARAKRGGKNRIEG